MIIMCTKMSHCNSVKVERNKQSKYTTQTRGKITCIYIYMCVWVLNMLWRRNNYNFLIASKREDIA